MGTRLCVKTEEQEFQDHPHACGDKWIVCVLAIFFIGSSPRVWGQGDLSEEEVEELGIIPTRVGTSNASAQHCFMSADHPHACGDKTSRKLWLAIAGGSSPRVWGQAQRSYCSPTLPGIIPTRVGTRRFCFLPKCPQWDHPHACGDKLVTVQI